MTGILAGAVFVVLFIGWAVVPSRIRKMHESKTEENK
jgi:hypothetical protein